VKLSCPDRVVAALKLQPMTVKFVAHVLCEKVRHVDLAMNRLARRGAIRPNGFEVRGYRRGRIPMLWRLA
jgi:hypothetical protein